MRCEFPRGVGGANNSRHKVESCGPDLLAHGARTEACAGVPEFA
jgi:hypothetical protein